MLGVQALPLRSEVAAPELRKTLFFSLTIWLTASATPELSVSTMTSALPWSNHSRAMLEPISTLF